MAVDALMGLSSGYGNQVMMCVLGGGLVVGGWVHYTRWSGTRKSAASNCALTGGSVGAAAASHTEFCILMYACVNTHARTLARKNARTRTHARTHTHTHTHTHTQSPNLESVEPPQTFDANLPSLNLTSKAFNAALEALSDDDCLRHAPAVGEAEGSTHLAATPGTKGSASGLINKFFESGAAKEDDEDASTAGTGAHARRSALRQRRRRRAPARQTR